MFRSTAQENGVNFRNQTTNILSGTKDLLIKIADSYIDLNEISLDDQVLVVRGICQSEMNEFKEILKSYSNEIMNKLSFDECKKLQHIRRAKS